MKSLQFGLILWLSQTAWAAKCYSPAGEDINVLYNATGLADYAPCNNVQGSHSMCCAIGPGRQNSAPDACLSNGLCSNSIVTGVWRESCTDPTWQDPACIKLFLNGTGYQGGHQGIDSSGRPHTDVLVTPCGDGSYCYGNNNPICCQKGQGVFINAQGQQTDQNPNATTSTTANKGSPSATAVDSASLRTRSSGLSTGAKIGIGIGAAVGVLLIVAVVVGVFLLRKRWHLNATEPKPYRPFPVEISATKRGSGQQVFHEVGGQAYTPEYYAPVAQKPRQQHLVEMG